MAGEGFDVLIKFFAETGTAEKNVKTFDNTLKGVNQTVVNNTTVIISNTKAGEKLTETTNENIKAGVNWNTVITSTVSALGTLVSVMSNVINQHGIIGFVRDASSAIFDFGKQTAIAATIATGLTAYLGNEFVNAFKSVNTEMLNVNSVLLETPRNLELLNDKVEDLSVSFKLATQTQIAAGLYDVASAGISGADGITVMNSAVKASVAGLTDVKSAATPLVQILNATGKSASESEAIMNSMFKTVQRGVLTFQEYGQGIGRVIGTAQSLSVSLATLNGGIALLTKMGSQPEAAFTNMNSLLLAFAAMSDTAKKKAFDLGIQIDANAIKSKGLEKVVAEMVSAAEKTGDLNGTLFTLLGRQEALDAAIKLSADSGKLFRKEVEENINSNNALDLSLEQNAKSYENQEKAISVGANNIKVTTGKIVSSWVGTFFPALQKVIDYFNNLDNVSKKFLVTAALVPPIVGSIVTGIGLLIFGLIAFAAQMVISSAALILIKANLASVGAALNFVAVSAVRATGSMLGFATSNATASAAVATFTTTLKAAAITAGSIFAVFTAGAVAIGLVTKAVLDMRTAFKEEENQERESAETSNKNAGRLRELREKENDLKKEGKHLTSEEAREYAHLLVTVTDGAKKSKELAQEKINDSKKYLEEEKKNSSTGKKLTDEQLKDKIAFERELTDAELRESDNKLKLAKIKADQWREDELTKLKGNIAIGIVLKTEEAKYKAQIERGYQAQINEATDAYNKEQKSKIDAHNREIKEASKNLLDTQIHNLETQFKTIEAKEDISREDRAKKLTTALRKEAAIYKEYGKKGVHTEFDSSEKSDFLEKATDLNNKALKIEKDYLAQVREEKYQHNLMIAKGEQALVKQHEDILKKQGQDTLKYEQELEEQIFSDESVLAEDKLAILQQKLEMELMFEKDTAESVLKIKKQIQVLEIKDREEKYQKLQEMAHAQNRLEEIEEGNKRSRAKKAMDRLQVDLDLEESMSKTSLDMKLYMVEKELKDEGDVFGKNTDDYKKLLTERNELQKRYADETFTEITRVVSSFSGFQSFYQDLFRNLESDNIFALLTQGANILIESIDHLSNAFDKKAKGGPENLKKANDEFIRSIPILGNIAVDVANKIEDALGLPLSDKVLKATAEMKQGFEDLGSSAAKVMLEAAKTINDMYKSLVSGILAGAKLATEKIIETRKESAKAFDESIKDWTKFINGKTDKLEKAKDKEIEAIKEVGKARRKDVDDAKKAVEDTLKEIDKLYQDRIDDQKDKSGLNSIFQQRLGIARGNEDASLTRPNELDFNTGNGLTTGNETQRKKIQDDYELGVLSFDQMRSKMQEVALQKYLFYEEEINRVQDPELKANADAKRIEAQKEFYQYAEDKQAKELNKKLEGQKKELSDKLSNLKTYEREEIASIGRINAEYQKVAADFARAMQQGIDNIKVSGSINGTDGKGIRTPVTPEQNKYADDASNEAWNYGTVNGIPVKKDGRALSLDEVRALMSAGGYSGNTSTGTTSTSARSKTESAKSSTGYQDSQGHWFDASGRQLTFAKGGVTNRPSIFGEAGPEAAIPLFDFQNIYNFVKRAVSQPSMSFAGGPSAFNQTNYINIDGSRLDKNQLQSAVENALNTVGRKQNNQINY